uniref:DUF4806 domain-containing protein n=1 Tax=Anopheles funestus TaxID=62324 RepID=A0A4Y0BPV9_ANOFN
MPYAVVETTDTLGNKELLAAPESWIQEQDDGKQYLCWPNVRNITTLNALLQNDCSVPSLMWEKHECMVKRHNIVSLELATKAIEGIQRQSEKKTSPVRRVVHKSPDIDAHRMRSSVPAKNARERHSAGQSNDSIPVEENAQEPSHDFPSDPLDETRLSAKVSKMFNELKNLIDSNQEEMTKKMNEGFYRVQKSMATLMHQRTGQPLASTSTVSPTSNRNENLDIRPLKTIEEMNDFEERLKDEDYRKQVRNWIESVVSYERNPECRMMEILDLLFDRHLLPNFSWTGASAKGVKKHAFGEYRNIILLFTYAGTTSMHRADKTFVANFFKKKLRHAPIRAVLLKGMRRCVPHSPAPRSIIGRKRVKNIGEMDSSAKYVKISKVVYENVDRDDCSDEDKNDIHQFVVDHEYTDFKRLQHDSANDLQPTLFMSAEDESE